MPTHVPMPALQRLLAPAVLRVQARRAARLKAGELPDPDSLLDRYVLAALVNDHKARGRLDELTPLHEAYWRSAEAAEFHGRVESRMRDAFLRQDADFVAAIETTRRAFGLQPAALCELGCGSGLLLDHLRSQVGACRRFIGLDLSEEQIQRNRSRFGHGTTLQFEAADAARWIDEHAAPGWIYVTYGGVLEYLPRPQLRDLLQRIARLRPAMLASVEPLADEHVLGEDARSMIYGAENTWSHDYPSALREVGFELRFAADRRVGMQRWYAFVATVR